MNMSVNKVKIFVTIPLENVEEIRNAVFSGKICI